MSAGERVQHLARFGPQGWPKCAVCQKPVDMMIARGRVDGDVVTITAHCHGAEETVPIPSTAFDAESVAFDGLAFVPPKALLP